MWQVCGSIDEAPHSRTHFIFSRFVQPPHLTDCCCTGFCRSGRAGATQCRHPLCFYPTLPLAKGENVVFGVDTAAHHRLFLVAGNSRLLSAETVDLSVQLWRGRN